MKLQRILPGNIPLPTATNQFMFFQHFSHETGARKLCPKSQSASVTKLISKSESKEADYSEVKDEIKAALLGEKRRKAYESKINQLKIMYPVDMAGF